MKTWLELNVARNTRLNRRCGGQSFGVVPSLCDRNQCEKWLVPLLLRVYKSWRRGDEENGANETRCIRNVFPKETRTNSRRSVSSGSVSLFAITRVIPSPWMTTRTFMKVPPSINRFDYIIQRLMYQLTDNFLIEMTKKQNSIFF